MLGRYRRGWLPVLRCEALNPSAERKRGLNCAVRGALVLGMSLGLVACSPPQTHRDAPLIHPDDGRSTLAKRGPDAAAATSSGARRVDLRSAPAAAPLGIPRYVVDAVVQDGPGRLLQLVPLAPVFDARRRFRGFRIVRIHDNSAKVLRYGILPGDVLVSVNGLRITRPTHMLALFKLLSNATLLDIRVQRDHSPVHVQIPIVENKDGNDTGTRADDGPI